MKTSVRPSSAKNGSMDIFEPIFDKQMCIGKEFDSLTKQRNELLPLLMNGQVSVQVGSKN